MQPNFAYLAEQVTKECLTSVIKQYLSRISPDWAIIYTRIKAKAEEMAKLVEVSIYHAGLSEEE